MKKGIKYCVVCEWAEDEEKVSLCVELAVGEWPRVLECLWHMEGW